jgi:molybdopterin-guanine dinucleotide biosynthesis protein A
MTGPAIAAATVCAVVLAGGRATRMGGVDKGLQTFHGQALAATALQRLRAQTSGAPGLIGISANRNHVQYAAMGVPVWGDTVPDFAGPLAGFLAAMDHSQNRFDYVLSVPCDSPRFPLDLLERLAAALVSEQTEIAMALAPDAQTADPSQLYPQPVFCLMRNGLADQLRDFLADGGRKIGAWVAGQRHTKVAFNHATDDPRAFANANTLAELYELEKP